VTEKDLRQNKNRVIVRGVNMKQDSNGAYNISLVVTQGLDNIPDAKDAGLSALATARAYANKILVNGKELLVETKPKIHEGKPYMVTSRVEGKSVLAFSKLEEIIKDVKARTKFGQIIIEVGSADDNHSGCHSYTDSGNTIQIIYRQPPEKPTVPKSF